MRNAPHCRSRVYAYTRPQKIEFDVDDARASSVGFLLRLLNPGYELNPINVALRAHYARLPRHYNYFVRQRVVVVVWVSSVFSAIVEALVNIRRRRIRSEPKQKSIDLARPKTL